MESLFEGASSWFVSPKKIFRNLTPFLKFFFHNLFRSSLSLAAFSSVFPLIIIISFMSLNLTRLMSCQPPQLEDSF